VLITESHLRKIIREALSAQQFDDLVQQARSEVLDYIDNPDDSVNTFRKLLNVKLSKLGVAALTDDEVKKLKEFVRDITVEIVDKCTSHTGRCVGKWSPSESKISVDKQHVQSFSRARVVNTIYHEFYHALDDSFDEVLNKKLSTIWTGEESEKWNKSKAYRDLIEKEFEEFESQREPVWGEMTELFAEELASLRDEKVMNSSVAWAKKSLKLFPAGALVGHVPIIIKQDKQTSRILNEPMHAYVAIHQLRRQFPGKSISQICNAPLLQREKLGYWEKVFLISFKCGGEADEAFKSIATHMAKKEPDTRTV
jgi:hypothetical protein